MPRLGWGRRTFLANSAASWNLRLAERSGSMRLWRSSVGWDDPPSTPAGSLLRELTRGTSWSVVIVVPNMTSLPSEAAKVGQPDLGVSYRVPETARDYAGGCPGGPVGEIRGVVGPAGGGLIRAGRRQPCALPLGGQCPPGGTPRVARAASILWSSAPAWRRASAHFSSSSGSGSGIRCSGPMT